MIDDRIPEESEEHYTQLTALLRCGLRESTAAMSSTEQSRIIARVRERLTRADALSPQVEEMPVQHPLQTRSRPILSLSSRRWQLARFVRDLAAVLLVGMLVGAALLMFRSAAHQTATHPSASSTGPSAVTEFNGLQASIQVLIPGPYFLSELVSVDVGLTNHTGRPLLLPGSNKPDSVCFSSALSVQITAGSAPTYTAPKLDMGCLLYLLTTTLGSGQTLTMHDFLPVTKSGEVTITMGGKLGYPDRGDPLAGHWPSVSMQVALKVPSNRALSLRNQGAQVIVQAPPAARAHLVYLESISCDQYGGGSQLNWNPLPTHVLSQPACPTPHKHWEYIVSAPGYAIVAGKRDS